MGVEPRVISASRAKQIAVLLVSLGFVAIAVFVRGTIIRDWGGWRWAIGLFFGLGAVVIFISLFRPNQLHLDSEAFTLTGGLLRKPARYSWREIAQFKPFRVSTLSSLVGFDFHPNARRQGALANLNRTLGVDAALPGSWSMSTARMVETLNDYRARALASDASA